MIENHYGSSCCRFCLVYLLAAKKYQEIHSAAGGGAGDSKKKEKKPAQPQQQQPKKEKAAPAPKVLLFVVLPFIHQWGIGPTLRLPIFLSSLLALLILLTRFLLSFFIFRLHSLFCCGGSIGRTVQLYYCRCFQCVYCPVPVTFLHFLIYSNFCWNFRCKLHISVCLIILAGPDILCRLKLMNVYKL